MTAGSSAYLGVQIAVAGLKGGAAGSLVVQRTLQTIVPSTSVGKVYVDLDSIHVFVFGVVGFAGMLAGSLWLLDKLIEFKRQKITFVVAFITAAVLSNYFYPSMCGSTP